MTLTNQTAIVTGGARGIGAAITETLVAEGMQVMIADILDDDGKALADRLGERAAYVHLDVTNTDQWAAAVTAAEQSYGPVSVLVNNAGVLDFGAIADQDPASFRRVIDINLYGAWLGMHQTVPSMRRAGGGCIVNVSSTAGLMGYGNLGAYVASKWGLRGLTKTAAMELAPDQIRVCSVHPGPIATPMTAGFEDSVVAGQPIRRFGRPEEVARMVRFVVGEATYSTGTEFVVDGGATTGVTPEVHEPQ
ncbi:glucose 1-dehydrogenase [Natronosporangium hydrolyticum]|uniref:Glucose 1-dehydrogenase n=1 Tax=Natronosporangium hydrolyticum TaxID=2811111 RepID=A0A895YM04_9ACTN|nr:glucose 1-dehydrogenase [Natronosporangium hydrolyticum]QSB16509.1 glucose 1-dehydrogenase [Natronosporangium hydrolyticum]